MKFLLVICLVAAALSMYSCQNCAAEYDMDFRGVPTANDIGYDAAASVQACCTLCNNNVNCNAWTYVSQTQVCYLKNAVGLRLPTTGRISGLKQATSVSVCIVESGSNVYIGNDLGQPTQNIASQSDCCNLCGQTTGCTAWTYLSDYDYCYLKSGRGTLLARANSFSGYLANGNPVTAAPTTPTTTATTTTTTVTVAPTTSNCVTTSGLLYPGADIPGGAYVATSQDCCNLCGRTAACNSFDYFSGYCFLKNQLPVARTPSPTAGAVSGIVQ